MNSLDRAKAFLKGRGTKLALTIIPLATIAASSAQATVAGGPFIQGEYAFAAYSGLYGHGSLSTSGVGASVVDLPGGGTGLRLSGGGSFSADLEATYRVGIVAYATSNGTPSVEASYPVSYSFSVTTGGGTLESWDMLFEISQGDNWYTYDDTSVAADTDPTINVTGRGLITGLDPSLPIDIFGIKLDLRWYTTTNQTLGFDLPAEIDHVPEPASLLLVGTGLGLLMLLRRRLKA